MPVSVYHLYICMLYAQLLFSNIKMPIIVVQKLYNSVCVTTITHFGHMHTHSHFSSPNQLSLFLTVEDAFTDADTDNSLVTQVCTKLILLKTYKPLPSCGSDKQPRVYSLYTLYNHGLTPINTAATAVCNALRGVLYSFKHNE